MIRKTRGRALAAALLPLLLAATAGAQEVPPSPAPSPEAAPRPGIPEATGQAPVLPSPANPRQDAPVLNLSLDEAVRRTLENNVDIAVQRFDPEASDIAVDELRGVYEPILSSTVTQRSSTAPATNVFAGAAETETDTLNYNFGAFQQIPTGGQFRVDFTNRRTATNSVFESFNPQYRSDFNLQFTQPVLRNLAVDSNRYQIKVAKKNQDISDVQFRQTVANTVAGVKSAYYDLLYAIDNLEAQRKSLALATRLLDENRIRVRVGTMAPLDVVAAESEQASREEAVIVAEAAVAEAEDALKRAIFNDASDPAVWATRIVPTDRPTAEPASVDVEAATRTALEKRTDMSAARMGLDNAEYGIEFARNQLLPQLDLVANYGTTGTGGTFFEREGFGGPVLRTVPGGYSDAVSDVFGFNYPTWSIGLNVSYPVLNRQARAARARAQVRRDQSQASLRRLEMQVTAEVRSAARAVETNFKRVESTRAARVLAERRLDAETKRFAAGMSTNFLVTQSQRDLALAEVAELRAVADYRKSQVNFERVQEAGGGSVGGVTTISSSGRGGSGTTAIQ
ncbi:MAG TPA: TolC family protein [Vicinamibacteria bacterium]|nr:TolC family protein [Vicinamibacteria bacterium]